MDKEIQKSFKKLEIVNHWIANCDSKSSFLLTFYGVIITIIFTSDINKDILKTLSMDRSETISWINIKLFISFIILLFFFLCIVITVYHIYYTLRGRINASVYKQNGLNTNSLIFFGSIKNKTFIDFETRSNTESDVSHLNDINSQVFINSKIASEKFDNYNKSLMWLIVSFLAFLFYLIMK